MIFIDNKYTRLYYTLIKSAKSKKYSGYTETHHIVPKSLGGSNDSDNLVVLSAREHFLCHWLLTKMVKSKRHQYQMWNAMTLMMYTETKDQKRYKVTGRTYQNLKEQQAVWKSWRFSGDRNPQYGVEWSQERRKKHSERLKGRVVSEETREKLRIRNREINNTWTSAVMKAFNPNDIKLSCTYCKQQTSLPAFKRHHGEKCRKNPNNPNKNKVWKQSICNHCKIEFEHKSDVTGMFCSNKCYAESGHQSKVMTKQWEEKRKEQTINT